MLASRIVHLDSVELLASRMMELYVSDNSRYIYQTKQKYTQIKKPITIEMLRSHIEGKRTYGIFAAEEGSRFITFDIDVKANQRSDESTDTGTLARWIGYKLIFALESIGVDRKHVNVSHSGNKGLHIDIFFSEIVPNEDIKRFHEYVLTAADLVDVKHNKTLPASIDVELRPTATQGVKLPLGKHKTTNNLCHFVDNQDLNKPLDSDALHRVHPLPVDTFSSILKEYADTPHNAESIQNNRHAAVKIGTSSRKQLERFLYEGLQEYGTRHSVTFRLALYVKDVLLMDEEEAEETLIRWLDKQTNYSTPYEEAVKDTRRIISYVFKRDLPLLIGNDEITFSKDEIYEILVSKQSNGKATTPKQKTIMFALLGHSKRYAANDGTFFMAYSTMTELTSIKRRETLSDVITMLSESGFIEVIQRNKKVSDTRSATNIYRLKTNKKGTSDCGGYTSHDYGVLQFKESVSNLFSHDELKTILPRRQFEKLT